MPACSGWRHTPRGAEVFELGLHPVESEAVGEGRIDIERFAGNLVLLVGGLALQGAHVVQAVTYLDEDDADVIAHGEEQLLEVLGLGRSLVAEDTSADLRQSVDNLRHLGAEDVLDILGGVVGIFHHVVQQGGTDTHRAEPHLLAGYLGHGDGVHDIGFARKSSHSLVCLTCKVECLGNQVYLLLVSRGRIGLQQMFKGIIDHLVIGGLSGHLLLFHSCVRLSVI